MLETVSECDTQNAHLASVILVVELVQLEPNSLETVKFVASTADFLGVIS